MWVKSVRNIMTKVVITHTKKAHACSALVTSVPCFRCRRSTDTMKAQTTCFGEVVPHFCNCALIIDRLLYPLSSASLLLVGLWKIFSP
ncbi:hypothetical protein AMECASPLE_037865 [Ameca splendens]|uniref:Secreted protein n=1 Tax=Ameca splendens TaxID=208324 RepID=A0ABV0Y8P6_9TELE